MERLKENEYRGSWYNGLPLAIKENFTDEDGLKVVAEQTFICSELSKNNSKKYRRIAMNKELRNKISENKILTYHERAKIISDLESYEDIRAKLEQIERIIDEYDLEAWEILEMIKEVIENENT